MDKCPLCKSLLRIYKTTKSIVDIPDDPKHTKVITRQLRTCQTRESPNYVINDPNYVPDSLSAPRTAIKRLPCPNFGLQLDTVVHEEIIDRETNDEDLKLFVEKVIVDKFSESESMVLATKITTKTK